MEVSDDTRTAEQTENCIQDQQRDKGENEAANRTSDQTRPAIQGQPKEHHEVQPHCASLGSDPKDQTANDVQDHTANDLQDQAEIDIILGLLWQIFFCNGIEIIVRLISRMRHLWEFDAQHGTGGTSLERQAGDLQDKAQSDLQNQPSGQSEVQTSGYPQDQPMRTALVAADRQLM